MASFSVLRKPIRAAQRQYAQLPLYDNTSPRRRNFNEEKDEESYSTEEDSEYSDYEDHSPTSSRSTSGSYTSDQPLQGKKHTSNRRRPRRFGVRIVRYICYGLISTIVIFIIFLVRMSVVSSKQVQLGDLGDRPPPPPPTWESFDFLARYYGGLKTLVPSSRNPPEYPKVGNETVDYDGEFDPTQLVPQSKPFLAYANRTSESAEYAPVCECFLDAKSKISIPPPHYYEGRAYGFPEHVIGSYEVLDLPEDVCFDRYGKLGSYGYGYEIKAGGTGAGLHGHAEGSEEVWKNGGKFKQIDYRNIDWADAQRRCYDANSERFEKAERGTRAPTSFSVGKNQKRDGPANLTTLEEMGGPKKTISRTAIVVRTYDDFRWDVEDIINLRAMIMELALGSGGEYDVHLLVEVHNEARHPIWADAATYHAHLEKSVPKEFHGIATLWSQTQMLMLYQGMLDRFPRGENYPIHGSYRGLQMAMQHFAQRHPDYEFFWHWELDARYTGHYYDLFSKIDKWTSDQPRKGLWERSSRFYIPSVHGTWEDFKQMSRVQSEMGTESPNNIWSSLRGAKSSAEVRKTDPPIWGPERPPPSDWFEIDTDPEPPHTYERDKYEWGVGESADLITFNPLFDPDGTTWILADDITGYTDAEGPPPRRAAIISASRMSRRLLSTMHRETAFRKHFAFTEMWAPTVALHHGYKAVYAPHPVFVDRDWPVEYLASVMNAGRNGATGGARTSVFGEREHHFKGTTWYYNAGFAANMWRRWLGLKVDNEGGEEFEMVRDEGRDGKGVLGMRGGEGRMCLPPMLLHPVKGVVLPVEEAGEGEELEGEEEMGESDPSA